jgi:serine/threonine protein kinase/Tol biopolymer transport system component
MVEESWQNVTEIFDSASRLAVEKRSPYLDRVCGSNKTLRSEIESLLESLGKADEFLEGTAIAHVAEVIACENRQFDIKKCIGHYEILERLGAGGMGEVFLATDMKLDRKVAIKILNEDLAEHESYLERFVGEARAASALNHPNILVVHEIGETDGLHYIVSEHVEGITLREIIKESRLELPEILDISIQIASALAAVHSLNIIHRDIKPENIMVRDDGYVKILDFGLAKPVEKKTAGFADKSSGRNETAKGLILGTVNYMSPEQAKRLQVDERTDIFSLGVVLYEMLSGKTPFGCLSATETLTNLINQEPPLPQFVNGVSEKLQRIVSKTLKKNKDERYQTMEDLLSDLEGLRETSVSVGRLVKTATIEATDTNDFLQPTTDALGKRTAGTEHGFSPPFKSHNPHVTLALAATLILGAVSVLVFRWFFFESHSGDVLTIERMRQTRLTQSGDVFSPTMSPNGKYLVYVNIDNGKRSLRLQQIANGKDLELLPPRSNVHFWSTNFSRDSNYVYYTENKDNNPGVIYRIPSLGGEPQKIVEFVDGGLTISPDGARLAFVRTNLQEKVTSIVVVNSDGSDERLVASMDTDSTYQSLDWSPDGMNIAYAVKHHEPKNDSWYIAEISATGGAERRISDPRNFKIITALWLPDKQGFVMNAIDPKTKQPQIYFLSSASGEERRITNDLNYYFGISISSDGKSIVTQRMEQDRQIWILPQGTLPQPRQLTFKKEQHYESASWLTNDTLVFDVDENGTFGKHNIWRWKMGDSEPQILMTDMSDNYFPVVSPDGRYIAFISDRSGKPQIWRMNADGSSVKQVTDVDFDVFNPQFSPDGETLYFKTWFEGKGHLMHVSAGGGEAVSLSGETDIRLWAVSPDGKKLAYSTLDSETQKIVTRIRPVDRDQIEKVLDIEPVNWLEWSKDGQALYFVRAMDAAKNIWRWSLSEAKPQTVTDFNDREQIFRFFRSPDGKNLACLRFTENFDAIMLNFDK